MSLQEYAVAVAKDEKIDPNMFQKLIACESNWVGEAVGDQGRAIGILQFHRGTFDRFSKEYKLNLDINNSYHQIDLSTRMIADGYLFHWTCAYIIGWLK